MVTWQCAPETRHEIRITLVHFPRAYRLVNTSPSPEHSAHPVKHPRAPLPPTGGGQTRQTGTRTQSRQGRSVGSFLFSSPLASLFAPKAGSPDGDGLSCRFQDQGRAGQLRRATLRRGSAVQGCRFCLLGITIVGVVRQSPTTQTFSTLYVGEARKLSLSTRSRYTK